MTFAWDFGDGTQARGIALRHTYARIGNYDLKLTVGSNGARHTTYTKVINVVTHPTSYNNPYARHQQDGMPQSNAAVTLPTPNDHLSDKVTTTAAATTTASKPITSTVSSISSTTSSTISWIVGGMILGVLFIGGIVVVLWRRRLRSV